MRKYNNISTRNGEGDSDQQNALTRITVDERAAAWTLRASIFFLFMLAASFYVVNFTTSANIQDEGTQAYSEYQMVRDGQDILAIANATGKLKNATLFYDFNGSPQQFHDADDDGPSGSDWYVVPPNPSGSAPTHPLADLLEENLIYTDEANYHYNINLSWRTSSGDIERKRMVYQGAPGNNAVTATYIIYLQDEDVLLDENGDPVVDGSEVCTLENTTADGDGLCEPSSSPGFYVDDAFSNDRWNIVEVRITLWSK